MAQLFDTISDNSVLAGLFVAAVVAMVPPARRAVVHAYQWVRGQLTTWQRSLRRGNLESLRESMLQRANQLGLSIAVSRRGHRPEERLYSNQVKLYYYGGDLQAYKQDMERSAVPPRGAFHGNAPKEPILNEMSARQIRNWLRDHPAEP